MSKERLEAFRYRVLAIVLIPPGKKHWHAAAPASAMTHIAIVEKQDGKSADWMEKVSDE